MKLNARIFFTLYNMYVLTNVYPFVYFLVHKYISKDGAIEMVTVNNKFIVGISISLGLV